MFLSDLIARVTGGLSAPIRIAILIFLCRVNGVQVYLQKVFGKSLKRDVSRQAARRRIKKQMFVKSVKTRFKFTLQCFAGKGEGSGCICF